MRLIDSHCHLNHPSLLPNLRAILDEANRAGVYGFIIPGVIAAHWQEIIELGVQYSGCYPAAGLHPLFLKNHENSHLQLLKKLCEMRSIIAIGEIGLDFFHGRETQKQQQQLLDQQLQIAKNYDLPVILHVRKAHDEILSTLRRLQFKEGGSVHAFNGSLQQAVQYIELGFVLGVGGAITYDRAKKIRATIKQLPTTSLVLETDSPDMLLAGKKDGPNLPQYLPEVLQVVADVKEITSEELGEVFNSNISRIFRIPSP